MKTTIAAIVLLSMPAAVRPLLARTSPPSPATHTLACPIPPRPHVKPKPRIKMGRLGREYLRYQDNLGWGAAACGLVAAEGFWRFRYNKPGKSIIGWVRNVALHHRIDGHPLWNSSAGMYGPKAEQALLHAIGLKTHLVDTGDRHVAKRLALMALKKGRPMIVSTYKHYFVIEGRHWRDGCFFVGNSGRVMQAHGHAGASPCMTMTQIESVGTGINGLLLFAQ